MYIHLCTYIPMDTYTLRYTHIHAHLYPLRYTHFNTYIHTFILFQIHTHSYICIYAHTCILILRHTCFHTWTIMSLRRISFREKGSVCAHNLRDIVHHTGKAGGWSLKQLAAVHLPSISRVQMGNGVGLQALLPLQWVTSPVRLLKVPQPSKIVPISGN